MQAGFASMDITPPIGKERPGSLTKAYSQGFHDPLLATAAVFDDGEQRVALVGVDALSLRARTVRAAREQIEDATGIPGDHVMIAASHTHKGGPCVGALPGEFAHAFDPEFCEYLALERATAADPCYIELLAGMIASAVITADRNKQPAFIAAGVGKEDSVTFNRRFWMRNGCQRTHPGRGNPDIVEPAGPIDPDVGVLGAFGEDGRLLGCVVNFACHGTVMSGADISADWPYFMRQTIEGALGARGKTVFLNGACGDITQVDNLSPYEVESGEWYARRIGQSVGGEALKVLAKAWRGEKAPVAAVREILRIPTREVSEERFQEALAYLKEHPDDNTMPYWYARDAVLLHEMNKVEPEVPCEIQAIQVGPVGIVSNPAEFFCVFGLEIKRRSAFPVTLVVELANGCVGYVPTEEAMGPKGGGYEPNLAMTSKLVPAAGRMITDKSIELLGRFQPGPLPERPPAPPWRAAWNLGSAKAE